VTRDGLGVNRAGAAANICPICPALLMLIPAKRWGERALGKARSVELHTLVSTKSKNVSADLWAVTWSQPITLISHPDAPLGAALYVSQAPDVGAAHETDYREIG